MAMGGCEGGIMQEISYVSLNPNIVSVGKMEGTAMTGKINWLDFVVPFPKTKVDDAVHPWAVIHFLFWPIHCLFLGTGSFFPLYHPYQ